VELAEVGVEAAGVDAAGAGEVSVDEGSGARPHSDVVGTKSTRRPAAC
jgi:hypothetical protein